MRSRYSAFVLEREQYLLDTWHAAHRPASVEFDPQTRWLGLEIRKYRLIDSDHAEVEFVARNRLAGRALRLHEVSRFVRQGDRWFYVDGDVRGAREAAH
jgi:SEC-C motif-containing protein